LARKILLADDSVTAQNMGRKILADAGYEVITVNNGSAALKKISEQRPDVIVLDVYMPGYSGLEVCQRLKEVGETSQIPILLTVGKLEPFKPEEVKRVRADAFIVKPFEASELLSALSKLEDRIVPRSESSKPGRFARVTAAIDEGRYDKTVAIEEDLSWKNRISFPSKKKEKEKQAQPEPDEAAAYSSGSKDLRTVIEHKLAETPGNGKGKAKEEERVDLGALAHAGLPKDVTPEEIAALAAAAAQMQGRIAESKVSEPPSAATTAPVETSTQQSRDELRSELQSEVPAPATFAEQKAPDQAEAKPADMAPSTPISELQPASAEPAADEPVTMAVGGSTPAPSRWTAVSVALAPEDAAISLEQEMQKAYAAFAAAETGHAGSAPNFTESGSTTPPPPVEAISSEPVMAVPASAAPEAAQTLTAVASAATDAMSAAAEQLHAVASSYVEQKDSVSPETSSTPAEQKFEPSVAHAEGEKPQLESEPLPPVTDLRAKESKDSAQPADAPSQPEISTESAPASASQSAQLASENSHQSAEAPIQNASEIAASTAAAWADALSTQLSSAQSSIAQSSIAQSSEIPGAPELAAKAVAAGAESSPADTNREDAAPETGSDPAIASIVDSVLAGLRPKIVEEISRKLGKKN
jgi:CheY-like chemotaxis protein